MGTAAKSLDNATFLGYDLDRENPGFRGGSHDFRTARTTDKTHGRLEQRTLTISSELNKYLDWPYCDQVFKLERHVVRIKRDSSIHPC